MEGSLKEEKTTLVMNMKEEKVVCGSDSLRFVKIQEIMDEKLEETHE